MRTRPGRELGLERLESRVLLAHNNFPIVSVSGTTLKVHGTRFDDFIVVDDTPTDGICVAWHLNFLLKTICAADLTTAEITRVEVDTFRGNDRVHFLFQEGSLDSIRVNTHIGADWVTFTGSAFGQDDAPGDSLVLNTGGGSDNIAMKFTEVNGSAKIVTGGGNDTLSMRDTEFQGSLTVNTRQGDDTVWARRLEVGGNASFYGRTGADTFDLAQTQVGGKALISGGTGADRIRLRDLDASSMLSIYGGTGDDCIELTRGNVDGELFINSGAGADVVVLNDSDFLSGGDVYTGAGNDVLGMYRSATGDTLTLNGNSGMEDQLLIGQVDLALLSWSGFELVDLDFHRIWCFEGPEGAGGITGGSGGDFGS